MADMPEACKSPDVQRILRPFNPDAACCQPKIELGFEVLKGTDPSLPAIVFLPGGPGLASIGTGRPSEIPSTFTVINTDPRGVGCNEYEGTPYPEEIYRTRYLASDVLAIVNHLNLKKYILYGHSYGTALATVTASMADEVGVPHPMAVVLEGTVGRAMRTKEEYTAGYLNEWEKLRARLPEKVTKLFADGPLPLDLSAETWGGFFHIGLMASETNGLPLIEHILNMLPGLLPSDAAAVKREVEKLSHFPFSEAQKHLYRSLACKELVEYSYNEYRIEGMNLVTIENDYCADTKIDEEIVFDSRNYTLRDPLYYFQGELDPATPMWQARLHFDAQTKARKAFVSVPRAGHFPISFSLDDCGAAIWTAIAGGGEELPSVLKTCKVAPTLN